jgi:hypothetical protein
MRSDSDTFTGSIGLPANPCEAGSNNVPFGSTSVQELPRREFIFGIQVVLHEHFSVSLEQHWTDGCHHRIEAFSKAGAYP